MADEEQLRILKQGPAAWNTWRQQAGDIVVDLSKADLRGVDLDGADLRKANVSGADLHRANLDRANLNRATLRRTDLSDADLRWAELRDADFTGADLRGANLMEANLSEAILTRAKLVLANLRGAYLPGVDLQDAALQGTIFSGGSLCEVNFREARTYDTVFSNVDLSVCKNLELIDHRGPSSIDFRTLQRSGRLPLAFLRGVGLPERLIENLPSILGEPIQHYSCFISYSSKDEEFVHRLHADLQNKGVRCWFAPHDMKIGAKILDTLDEAIRLRDKVLLVLSEASIASDWVEDEVTKAFAEERQRSGIVLFPVRLDDAVFAAKEAWALKLRDNRNIGDFRAWKDHDAYQKALARVLRDLKIEAPPG